MWEGVGIHAHLPTNYPVHVCLLNTHMLKLGIFTPCVPKEIISEGYVYF